MGLKDYEQSLTAPLREATVLLLLKNDEILLAMKKRGFGVGKYNGVGGKPNPGENILDTAIRESQEEINVTPLDLKKVAIINYHFPLHEGWGQQVHIFIATKWQGDPVETEEMKPKWFKLSNVPFQDMWIDDQFWMPKVFAGSLLKGSFMFGENEAIDDYYINEVKSIE